MIAKTKRAPSPKAPRPKPKQRIERDAFYGVAELREITGIGRNTMYAILAGSQRRYSRCYRVTGAEFLALRAAYYGYADVA